MPEEEPSGRWQRWQEHRLGERWTVYGVVVALIVAAVGFGVDRLFSSSPQPVVINTAHGSSYKPPSAPQNIDNSSDLSAYVASRPIWSAAPTIYPDALPTAFNDQVDEGGDFTLSVNIYSDQPRVATVSTLADQAPSLAGAPILTVGRIVSAIESNVGGGLLFGGASVYDVELTDHRAHVYVLIAGGDLRPGAVVWLPVVLVATGIGPRGSQTSYAVGLDDAQPDTHDDPVPGEVLAASQNLR